jgi:preprotein translocase subunit SecD
MILLLAPALLAIASAQDAQCRMDTNFEPGSKPSARAGAGLWIGGIHFEAGDIQSAVPQQSEYTQEWELRLTFTPSGHEKFRRAQHCGVGYPIEISFDRKLISSPRLNEIILGNQVSISGGFSQESAAAFAAQLHPTTVK